MGIPSMRTVERAIYLRCDVDYGKGFTRSNESRWLRLTHGSAEVRTRQIRKCRWVPNWEPRVRKIPVREVVNPELIQIQ